VAIRAQTYGHGSAGTWQAHISLAGSETSLSEPGYLAGAVEAAERAVTGLLDRLKT